MGTVKTRRRKINWMLGHIQVAASKDRIVDKEKLIAAFCIDHASTRKTALELLRLFEAAKKIKIEGNEIFPSEQAKLTKIPLLKPKK